MVGTIVLCLLLLTLQTRSQSSAAADWLVNFAPEARRAKASHPPPLIGSLP